MNKFALTFFATWLKRSIDNFGEPAHDYQRFTNSIQKELNDTNQPTAKPKLNNIIKFPCG